MSAFGKYSHGRYAVCDGCGARPCICPPSTDTPTSPIPITPAPKSGNAIPFAIWDVVIAQYELEHRDSSMLLYLCRLTIGYGHHAGDLISIAQLAHGLRISTASVKRSLTRLELLKLIERTRRREPGSRECAVTHIRVTLPDS